eukprot:6200610-Pleurochrysis_carterae.AAC.3
MQPGVPPRVVLVVACGGCAGRRACAGVDAPRATAIQPSVRPLLAAPRRSAPIHVVSPQSREVLCACSGRRTCAGVGPPRSAAIQPSVRLPIPERFGLGFAYRAVCCACVQGDARVQVRGPAGGLVLRMRAG